MTGSRFAKPTASWHATKAPLQAKRVWENMDGPNPCKVSKAFKLAGFDISDDQIRRWRAAGWEESESETDMQAAVRQIDRNAATILGDPDDRRNVRSWKTSSRPRWVSTRSQASAKIFQSGTKRHSAELMRVTDNRSIVEFIDQGSNLEVLRETNRRAQGPVQVLCNEVDRQRDVLVQTHATEAASLLNAMTNLLEAANRGMKHYLDVEERMMRVIEPNGTRGRGSLDDAVVTDVNPFDFGAHSKSPTIQP
jgi:hypothetical protein